MGLKRILAIVNPDNHSSLKLLEKLGFQFQGMVRMPGEAADVRLFEIQF